MANAVLGLALAQARAGADVRIAAADEGASPLYGHPAEADALLMRWSPRWRRNFGGLSFRGLPKSLRAEVLIFEPDVVHIHGEFNPDNISATRLARPALIVLSLQGAFDPAVFRKSRARGKRLYVRFARRALYRQLAAFHVLSPREDQHAKALAPGVPTYILPQGGGPAAGAVRIPEPTSDEATRLVFVGRLDVYTKGLDLLVVALATVVREDTEDIRLTLVGPDWLGGRAELERLTSELGIGERVHFTGALGAADVAALIDAAHCVTQPSRHEGFSLSTTEALVRGTPLILSRETGHASYAEVVNEPHVLTVSPETEALTQAIREVCKRRAELVRSARLRQPVLAAFFSWDRIAREHLATYRSLVEAQA